MEEVVRGRPLSRARKTRHQERSDRAGEAGPAPLDPPARFLDQIHSPADLKELDEGELAMLCDEIREFIVDVVSQKGGHLGASLGVVELTVALAKVLDLPRDRVVWDTGHQAYVHKVLTGRKDALWTIRQSGGISGFLRREESEYDAFGAGHASTAVSAALGMAAARELAGERYRVVAVIGDGAMTGGLAYEALNNAGHLKHDLLVVLNDNGMSIARNVGAVAHYLTTVQSSRQLKRIRDESMRILRKLPALGESVKEIAERLEAAVKTALVPGGLFEALGFNYFGPVDGHDLPLLLDLLPKVLERPGPVLLHVLTRKGKGLPAAELDDEGFHGVTPFDKLTGKAVAARSAAPPGYTTVFGDAMVEAGRRFPDVAAITAAMCSGTGLSLFHQAYPSRFYDVGIAEAHAVCFAAGLACEGIRPVATIYSTFLQRAYDQIVHDVALQKLPVVFALDRAGLVGADGPTHHGAFDLSYLRTIPHIVVAAPKDGNELRDLLWTALHYDHGPFAFRFPRDTVPEGYDPQREPVVLPIGSWEVLEEGRDLTLLAVGTMVEAALGARALLADHGVIAGVLNCRFVKPMDLDALRAARTSSRYLVTVEENALSGGFGAGVLETLSALGLSVEGVIRIGLPDEFVTHGPRAQLLHQMGLSADAIARRCLAEIECLSA